MLKYNKLIIPLFLLLLFSSGFLFGQKTLDHKLFIEKVKHSSDNAYRECIQQYDDYLNKFPNDVSVLIEKCKFIQFAQYDDYEEVNPNQEAFDSCSADLAERFPTHLEVLLFQTTYLWGDELEEVFEIAQAEIEENAGQWGYTNIADIYYAMASNYYYDEDYNQAFTFIKKSTAYNPKYEFSLLYAQILVELNKKEDALKILLSSQNTTMETWELVQRANLFLKLNAYPEALELYEQINQIDSTYICNADLAATLEGIGEYDLAREYLVSDVSTTWNTYNALRRLLKHDLAHQDGPTCIATYNEFRDLGYSSDPLGFYRLKVFFSHPGQAWKFRDIVGLLTLLLLLAILIVIPSIWILPIYFVGHHWKFLEKEKPYKSLWGLKLFWFVSVGYLLASFLPCIVEPETLYSLFNSSYFDHDVDISSREKGFESLIFMIILALFGFASMYKVNPQVLLSNTWTIGRSVLIGAGILFAFKIVSGIYFQIGVKLFDVSIDSIANISNTILASRQDIEPIISTFGKGVSLLLIGILGPVYEEIIFRGVILDSCQRYINFRIANVIQATLFAAIHLNLFLFPVFFLFGILTGIMRKKADGLLPGIVFHVLNNVLALVVIFAR